MRKLTLGNCSSFLGKLMALACLVGGMVASAQAQSGLSTAGKTLTVADVAVMLLDRSGAMVGTVPIDNRIEINTETSVALVEVTTYTSVPSDIAMSSLAPDVTDTPQKVLVRVPATLPLGFCVSGTYYNRATGRCSDGKFPYKVVPIISLPDPAAKTPNVICTAPRVPTFNSSTKKWDCLVPTGFKLTLGSDD
jgi:hypothetical protein